eukprot:5553243-Amphidinium_carterae.1
MNATGTQHCLDSNGRQYVSSPEEVWRVLEVHHDNAFTPRNDRLTQVRQAQLQGESPVCGILPYVPPGLWKD